jgi:hypothetical protein
MDAASSFGHREANPLLRGSQGRYGWQGVAIKAGVMAGVLLAERFVLRRARGHSSEHRLRSAFTAINLSMSGVYTGAAIHNWRLP